MKRRASIKGRARRRQRKCRKNLQIAGVRQAVTFTAKTMFAAVMKNGSSQ